MKVLNLHDRLHSRIARAHEAKNIENSHQSIRVINIVRMSAELKCCAQAWAVKVSITNDQYYPRQHSTRLEDQRVWTRFENEYRAVFYTLIEPALHHFSARFVQAVKHKSSIREAKKYEVSWSSATVAVNIVRLLKRIWWADIFFNRPKGPKLDKFIEDTVLKAQSWTDSLEIPSRDGAKYLTFAILHHVWRLRIWSTFWHT